MFWLLGVLGRLACMDLNKKFFPESEGQYSYPARKSNQSVKAFRRYEFLYFAKTRPDTRPSVAHGWAGAVMLKNCYRKKTGNRPTDRQTERPTDRPTDGRTHPLRVAVRD